MAGLPALLMLLLNGNWVNWEPGGAKVFGMMIVCGWGISRAMETAERAWTSAILR